MDDKNMSISLDEKTEDAEIQAVRDGLFAYNLRYAPADNVKALNFILKTGNARVVGGLLGETYWGWLHIDILWIDDDLRHQGYGSRLLEMAEDEARRRGCQNAHLDTMSFQALPFYQKHGYQVFGELHDLPSGHSRIYITKKL